MDLIFISKFLDNILNRGGNHRYGARYDPTDIDVYLAPMKELDGGLDDDRDRYNRTLIWDKIWGPSPFQTENKNTSTMTKSTTILVMSIGAKDIGEQDMPAII